MSLSYIELLHLLEFSPLGWNLGDEMVLFRYGYEGVVVNLMIIILLNGLYKIACPFVLLPKLWLLNSAWWRIKVVLVM